MARPVNVPEHLDNLRIPMNQTDCDLAVAADQFNCGLVRAIQRIFPDAVNVRVNTKKIAWSDVGLDKRFEFDTPEDVVEDIIRVNDTESPQAVTPRVIRLKGGRMRDRDHDTVSRTARKERVAERERRQKPEYQERGSTKVNQNSAGYQRFAPDQ